MFHWVLALETLTLTLLPPLYFFSFLYYTDIVSITFVLAMVYYSLKQRYLWSSVFGLGSVLMRQTNIVWVGIIFAQAALDNIASVRRKKVPEALKSEDLFRTVLDLLKDTYTRPRHFLNEILLIVRSFWGFIVVLASFVAFVIVNGSIVVGDKSAHEATPHFAQVINIIALNKLN